MYQKDPFKKEVNNVFLKFARGELKPIQQLDSSRNEFDKLFKKYSNGKDDSQLRDGIFSENEGEFLKHCLTNLQQNDPALFEKMSAVIKSQGIITSL